MKEGRKKEASKVKQTQGKATQHTHGSHMYMYMCMYTSVHVVHIVLPEHGLPAEVHGDGVESHRVGADERERPLGVRPSLTPRQVDAGHSGRCVCGIDQCSVIGRNEGSQ